MKLSHIAIAASFATLSTFASASTADLTTFQTGINNDWNNSSVSVSTDSATLYGDATLTGNVNSLTSFSWNFTAGDYMPFDDTAWFSLNGGGQTYLSSVGAVGDYGNSGNNTYTFATPFTGSIQFGIANTMDSALNSQVTISNLQVAAVPEPESYALMLAGLGMMGVVARRRKQNAAV